MYLGRRVRDGLPGPSVAGAAFEVTVVKDATAGTRRPELGNGYRVAIVNRGYMAHDVLSTGEVVPAIG